MTQMEERQLQSCRAHRKKTFFVNRVTDLGRYSQFRSHPCTVQQSHEFADAKGTRKHVSHFWVPGFVVSQTACTTVQLKTLPTTVSTGAKSVDGTSRTNLDTLCRVSRGFIASAALWSLVCNLFLWRLCLNTALHHSSLRLFS